MGHFRTIPMPFFKKGRAANHTSYVYAVGTSLPMEEIAVHSSNVHAVALDYPNNTKSWNRKGYDHTSPRSPVVKSCLHPTAQIGSPVSLNDASGLTILTVSPPGSVSIRQDFFWERAATVLSYHLAPIARASAAAAAHDRPDNMQRP